MALTWLANKYQDFRMIMVEPDLGNYAFAVIS